MASIRLGVVVGARIGAEFLADRGELFWIDEVGLHHLARSAVRSGHNFFLRPSGGPSRRWTYWSRDMNTGDPKLRQAKNKRGSPSRNARVEWGGRLPATNRMAVNSLSTRMAEVCAMHILALIIGAYLHLFGDVALCLASIVIACGMNGYVYDEYCEFPSRRAAAFELLPVPVGLSLAGLILARWGFVGM